MNLQAI